MKPKIVCVWLSDMSADRGRTSGSDNNVCASGINTRTHINRRWTQRNTQPTNDLGSRIHCMRWYKVKHSRAEQPHHHGHISSSERTYCIHYVCCAMSAKARRTHRPTSISSHNHITCVSNVAVDAVAVGKPKQKLFAKHIWMHKGRMCYAGRPIGLRRCGFYYGAQCSKGYFEQCTEDCFEFWVKLRLT